MTTYRDQPHIRQAWPAIPRRADMQCTGNCTRDRACDCVPDVDRDELRPEGEPLSRWERWRFWALIAFVVACGLVAVFA